MNTEIAEIMSKENVLSEVADKVAYQNTLTNEESEMVECLDAWAKEVGKTGHDANHEIAQMVNKAISRESITAPSELISMIFNESAIGEGDDWRGEKAPKNTIKVYATGVGANVDASYIDHTKIVPTWTSLQARTTVTMRDLRLNGYKTIAQQIAYIKEALENQKVITILKGVDNAITKSIEEATGNPTATSADALAEYLKDMSDGDECVMIGFNKYMMAISKLDGARSLASPAMKDQWNRNGVLDYYAGCRLFGVSGTKKTGNGDLLLPDKRVFGIAGKIGNAITRGEARVLQAEDITNETVTIKVSGFDFGYGIDEIEKAGKIVMAQ